MDFCHNWVKRWQLFGKRNSYGHYGIFLQLPDSESLLAPSLLLEWASQGRKTRAKNIELLWSTSDRNVFTKQNCQHSFAMTYRGHNMEALWGGRGCIKMEARTSGIQFEFLGEVNQRISQMSSELRNSQSAKQGSNSEKEDTQYFKWYSNKSCQIQPDKIRTNLISSNLA